MKEGISKAEEVVLLAIWRLGERAYGVSIRRQIIEDAAKDYTYGTLYGILRQLNAKGFVKKMQGAPTQEKGGRGKTFFHLTPEGVRALKDAQDLHRRIWRGIDDMVFDR